MSICRHFAHAPRGCGGGNHVKGWECDFCSTGGIVNESKWRVGQKVRYWVNVRADGKVGGWERYEWQGNILKINRTTCHVQRLYDNGRIAVDLETVPLARIIEEVKE